MTKMSKKPKIEIIRIPSNERTKINQLLNDGVQLQAEYSHYRTNDFVNISTKHKASFNRRLASKSCDNILNRINIKGSHLISKSEEHLLKTGSLPVSPHLNVLQETQNKSTRNKLMTFLKKLSPRLRRNTETTTTNSSVFYVPWLSVELSDTNLARRCSELSLVTDKANNETLDGDSRQKHNENEPNETSAEESLEDKKEESKTPLEPVACTSKDSKLTPSIVIASPSPVSDKSTKFRNQPKSDKLDDFSIGKYTTRPEETLEAEPLLAKNMSFESIGNCSLDVDGSLSDVLSNNEHFESSSVSEKTLNGSKQSLIKTSAKKEVKKAQKKIINNNKKDQSLYSSAYVKKAVMLYDSKTDDSGTPKSSNGLTTKNSSNGFPKSESEDVEDRSRRKERKEADFFHFSKKPSYLGLSCAATGYSEVINYDSKLREGCRSREQSPGESLVVSTVRQREASPNKNDSRPKIDFSTFPSNQLLSSLNDSKRQSFLNSCLENGSATNGRNSELKMDDIDGSKKLFIKSSTSTKTISTFHSEAKNYNSKKKEVHMERKSRSTEGFEKHTSRIETVHSNSVYSKLGLKSSSSKNGDSSKFYNTEVKTVSETNGSSEKMDSSEIAWLTKSGSKSFIQQRIERLYGPAALAQGFHKQRVPDTPTKLNAISNNSNQQDSSHELPVLRHLKPEFRAQLKFASVSPTQLTESARPLSSTSQNIRTSIESIPDLLPAAPEVVLPIEPVQASSSTNISVMPSLHQTENLESTITANEEKNGHYYLKLLKTEIEKLGYLATMAENVLESSENLSDEITGKFRSASGKARLLVRQKLHQFEGLCHKNLSQVPGEPFPTTSEDLAGFWDMVMLQVLEVYRIFDELEQLRKNNWVQVPITKTAVNTKKPVNGKLAVKKSTTNSKSDAAKKQREDTRKKMMEQMRKQMKELKMKEENVDNSEVKIFVNEEK